jgi:threonylcarbamoyladenosine tRNA methylthiotransferase MtaB
MPQVAPTVIKERARRLREATARRRAMWLAGLVGSRQRVLVEREDGSGHAENFAPVEVSHPREVGAIAQVLITGIEGGRLNGTPA